MSACQNAIIFPIKGCKRFTVLGSKSHRAYIAVSGNTYSTGIWCKNTQKSCEKSGSMQPKRLPRCNKCARKFPDRTTRDDHADKCKVKKFQMVMCGHHGDDQTTDDTVPGYVVCKHVLEENATVENVDYATEHELGAIICT